MLLSVFFSGCTPKRIEHGYLPHTVHEDVKKLKGITMEKLKKIFGEPIIQLPHNENIFYYSSANFLKYWYGGLDLTSNMYIRIEMKKGIVHKVDVQSFPHKIYPETLTTKTSHLNYSIPEELFAHIGAITSA